MVAMKTRNGAYKFMEAVKCKQCLLAAPEYIASKRLVKKILLARFVLTSYYLLLIAVCVY